MSVDIDHNKTLPNRWAGLAFHHQTDSLAGWLTAYIHWNHPYPYVFIILTKNPKTTATGECGLESSNRASVGNLLAADSNALLSAKLRFGFRERVQRL